MLRKYFFYTSIAAIFVASSSSAVHAQVLLSQYEFNNDLLNSSVPSDTNGNVAPDGTFMGGTPTFVTGIDGVANNAVMLDGIDDWIDITTDGHPGEQTGTDFFTYGPGLVSGTVMAWVKVDTSLGASSRWLMGSANEDDYQAFRVGWNGSQLEGVAQASDTPASQFRIADATHNTVWADGEWRHIAVSWDGAINIGNIYIDGSPVGPTISPGSTLSSGNTQTPWEFPMAIGAQNNGGTLEGFWQGAIDDLRIYADALSQSQIQGIIDATPVAVTPDFDMDADVDGNDFLIWQRGFGSGTTLAEGDANNSGSVDAADLAIWEGAFGESVNPLAAGSAVVPEPSTLGLLLVGTLATIARRRRRGTLFLA